MSIFKTLSHVLWRCQYHNGCIPLRSYGTGKFTNTTKFNHRIAFPGFSDFPFQNLIFPVIVYLLPAIGSTIFPIGKGFHWAGFAIKHISCTKKPRVSMPAFRALESIWPPNFLQVFYTCILGGKFFLKFKQATVSIFFAHRCPSQCFENTLPLWAKPIGKSIILACPDDCKVCVDKLAFFLRKFIRC